jgi:hypothetical protein
VRVTKVTDLDEAVAEFETKEVRHATILPFRVELASTWY